MKRDEPGGATHASHGHKEHATKHELEVLQARLREVEAERDRLRADVAENRDKYLRARADYDNLVKRAAKEGQESVRFAKSAILLRTASVLEQLDAAAKDAERRLGADAKGLRLAMEEAQKLLKEEGVKEIVGVGQPFNVRFHLAVDRLETDEHPEGTILDVIQRGYLWGDDVLRPALVKVAVPVKRPATNTPASPRA